MGVLMEEVSFKLLLWSSYVRNRFEKNLQKKTPYDGIYRHLKRRDHAFLNPQGSKLVSSKQGIKQEVHNFSTEVKKLLQMKDLLHFISSYHVRLLEDESDYFDLHCSIIMLELWIQTLLMNDTQASMSRHGLPISLHGIYILIRWRLMLEDLRKEKASWHLFAQGPRIEHIPSWAIKSAIHQAAQCILETNMRLIAISGKQAGEVAKAIVAILEIRSKFDIVLYISFSQHQSIEEIDECIEQQLDKFVQANTSLLSLQEVKTYRLLLMLDCAGEYIIHHHHSQTLKTLMDRGYACVVLATHLDNIYRTFIVDRGIRMEDHLLPLELFYNHAGLDHDYNLSSVLEELALSLLEQCHGDLLAVVLLAKELKGVYDVGIWKAANEELKSCHSSHAEKGVSDLKIGVLTFIWKQKDAITKLCIQQLATLSNQEKLTTTLLVSSWLAGDLVQTEGEGEEIIVGLTKSGLLQNDHLSIIIMREEIKDVLLKYVIPSLGLPLTAREIDEDAEIINLRDSGVAELPDSPICLDLVLLCLQSNCDLMMIPPLFFKHMPMLLTLNLSYTSIKTLPPSISALVSLRRLFLRGCDLFLELPCEIGLLTDLEAIDLEGTKVSYLPNEIAQLRKLQSLKLSFYSCGEGAEGSRQRIPESVLSNLKSLKELSIGVDPHEDDREWINDAQNILLYQPKAFGYNTLTDIMLHVPDIELLELLSDPWRNNYKLIVGRCRQRMISRIPTEVEEKFKQQRNYLHYVNGECTPTKIKDILRYTNAFILDRHWTVKSLSEFGTQGMFWLKLCLLVECNELQTIFDKDDYRFRCLEYLYVYYMKNLRSICSRKVTRCALYSLKFLSLCTCTSLISVFTISLLTNLPMLEELVVVHCPKIERLVTRDRARGHQGHFLPNLKKISLRELPELVSISSGLKIAPKLENLVIFDCPKLESLSEVLDENLKVIKGETEWWDSMPWKETDHLASIFVPLERDGDLMAQFTED